MFHFKSVEEQIKFHDDFADTKIIVESAWGVNVRYISHSSRETSAGYTVKGACKRLSTKLDNAMIWTYSVKDALATWVPSHKILDIDNKTLKLLYFKKGEL